MLAGFIAAPYIPLGTLTSRQQRLSQRRLPSLMPEPQAEWEELLHARGTAWQALENPHP